LRCTLTLWMISKQPTVTCHQTLKFNFDCGTLYINKWWSRNYHLTAIFYQVWLMKELHSLSHTDHTYKTTHSSSTYSIRIIIIVSCVNNLLFFFEQKRAYLFLVEFLFFLYFANCIYYIIVYWTIYIYETLYASKILSRSNTH